MNDNDENDESMHERTAHEVSDDGDLCRRMRIILPLLQTFLGRLDTSIAYAAAQGALLDVAALAVEYHLWRAAANKAIAVHWNQYEQGLTQAERDEQLPHADEFFAEEILRPTEFEAIKEYLAEVKPPKTPRESERLYETFEKVRVQAQSIDTTNTTSFAARSIKKSGTGDLSDH